LMCHPGHAPQHVRSSYAAQREIELETFTSEKARELVSKLGVELVTFETIRKRLQ